MLPFPFPGGAAVWPALSIFAGSLAAVVEVVATGGCASEAPHIPQKRYSGLLSYPQCVQRTYMVSSIAQYLDGRKAAAVGSGSLGLFKSFRPEPKILARLLKLILLRPFDSPGVRLAPRGCSRTDRSIYTKTSPGSAVNVRDANVF